jgi:hypothetical protein
MNTKHDVDVLGTPCAGRGAPISRREAMWRGFSGAAGVLLAGGLGASPPPATPPPRAKAVIQIWLDGGPAQTDTFDPKPEAGYDYCGPWTKPIATNVPGIRISETLPLLAQHADKYSIIRSMTHGFDAHETAAYIAQTGWAPGGRLVYPSAGAVVSLFKGYEAGYTGLIPPYVALTSPVGRFSETGFMGSRYKPFATGGNPALKRFAVEGITMGGISDKRQQARRDLLGKLNSLEHFLDGNARLAAFEDAEKQAYDLILGDAGKVFDLSQEKNEVRDRYGRNSFGQSCLVARRLVQRGVRYVTINWPGWDSHRQHFQVMRQKLPQLDIGFSALLEDLAARKLLDSTIVWWGGEFGRTPRILWEPPWNGGRHHGSQAYSVVVAGGGFKGGHVVGETDAKGEQVRTRPVYPCDLIGSIYKLLGIDLDAKLPHPQGLVVRATPTAADGVKMGGRLKEIM